MRKADHAAPCRVVPSPASLPPARNAFGASCGGAGRAADRASRPMSLRSIDRPSLPRHVGLLLPVAVVVRLAVLRRSTCSDESRKRCARESRYLHAPESCQQNPYKPVQNSCAMRTMMRRVLRGSRAAQRARCASWCATTIAMEQQIWSVRRRVATHIRVVADAARIAQWHREDPARQDAPRGEASISRARPAARQDAAPDRCSRRAGGSAGAPPSAPSHAPTSR